MIFEAEGVTALTEDAFVTALEPEIKGGHLTDMALAKSDAERAAFRGLRRNPKANGMRRELRALI